jgi:hypothetical protein
MTKTMDKPLHQDEYWLEDVDANLPEDFLKGRSGGQEPPDAKRIRLKMGIREYPEGKEVRFTTALSDTLLDVFSQGAEVLNNPLLPPKSSRPLDRLRYLERHGHSWSQPITDLEQPLWLALRNGCSRHLSIEYVLAVKINTKWGIAPSANASPRELLLSFGFDPAEFSLYRCDSTEPLPPDSPLSLKRGDMFEAQKDGRYGSNTTITTPQRGFQTIQDDVQATREAGIDARLLTEGAQYYVEVQDLSIPSPPWSKERVSIIISIPATYPAGGLDAFYVELPLSHTSGSIPNQQSSVYISGKTWMLISWHYASNRLWNPRHDDLASHITHCRGYFLRRGISQ